MKLTEEQINRYSRHILLKEVGGKGQQKLLNGRVLVIGAGGLGSPIALYLAAAGVGTIGIADADEVDLSNLQRQVIHFTKDVGKAKVLSAKEKMQAINTDVNVITYHTWVSADNIAEMIADYDFVIDGTDNFAAKFLINDACVLAGKPYSHGGILQFDGQTMTVKPGESPCYRCIFPEPPPKDVIPTCSRAGVIGVLPGVLGTLQATEAIKYLLGAGDLLTGRLLTYSALRMRFREVPIKKNPKCPVCGEHPTITELHDELDALTVCDLGH
ncbi:MAG TPA: molybdopterin-synthase adenylyltransferase MoeB [Geomonas sp.]|nr:molybdopterin-synthase adenylyltransferase MoeB [Geomonas sp.]